MTKTCPSPMRKVLFTVLLVVAAGITLDTYMFAQQGEITALRTKSMDEDAASVEAFCGFAPCGMPLECK